MTITGTWLQNAATQDLCKALEAAGHKALLVGGCVRNALIGVPVSDIDIATDALPETVSVIAENAGFRAVPTGIDHGTITVVAKGLAHEVTTFRRDVSTDGRRAVVAFSTRVEEDAARRDFTMNALYADRRGVVYDPLGGMPDLLARRVRFVGDPDARIREDYLRILRFFRFYAQYGDPDQGPDADALAACATNCAGIETLSKERLGGEMRKLLAAPDPAPAVASMAAAGVLAQVLPGADARFLAPLVHHEQGLEPDWLARLAVLGGSGDLRLSRAEARSLEVIKDQIGEATTPAALGHLYGARVAQAIVLVRAALLESPPVPQWRAEIQRGVGARFPVSAADLMPALTGPALGASLEVMKKTWLASDLRLDRAQLLG
jgi:poly(A) polymerase